jgi:hypothetical protein
MKRFSAILTVIIAGFCSAGALQAQTHEARATIPFNFVVGKAQLPAGHYTFLTNSENSIVIRNRNRPLTVISLIELESRVPAVGDSHLVFHKYGDHYFLSEVRCSWATMNGEVPSTKLEKKARTEEASVAPASVLIAAE